MTAFFTRFFMCLLLGTLSSCHFCSKGYRNFYAHLVQKPYQHSCTMQESTYFLIVLVAARHLDYSDNAKFFQTVSKHPGTGSRNGDVGHAWIYLQGEIDGQKIVVEGGHSGERGNIQAKYFEGIMNYQEWGYSNPTREQKQHSRYEPNPVKYLWAVQADGFFQSGSGGHKPTYAAKISLSKEEFFEILHFIHPDHYPYSQYALIDCQCSSFVTRVAALANWRLASEVTMRIQPQVYYNRQKIRLWEDSCYSSLTFSTPDAVERSLMQAVKEGQAEFALDWYLKNKNNN